uniref:Uncharacterized protein n=1 Tax=Tanacetum cinerariifolium TaxID=118510 RepID=A0A699H8S2_TANCI|nr:hypothetical protein [Tanacetum cinerariifolium]
MSLLQEALDGCAALARRVEHLEHDMVAQDLEIIKLKKRVKMLEMANKVKALKLRRLRKVGTSQRVDTSDDTIMEDASNQWRMIDELDRDEGAVKTVSDVDVVPTITAAPVKVGVPSTRRRRGVVIRDPEEKSSAKTPTETKSKDKEKDIDWEVAIDHVKQKAKENPYVQRLDYFKGMSYDDIRPIFEAKFNSNIEFLLKSKEQIKEEENRAIESINETPAQKATKRRRLNEEAEDVEELKQHLEIVPDEDDDVYT